MVWTVKEVSSKNRGSLGSQGNNTAGEEEAELPSSAEERWVRDQKEIAKPPQYAQTGWCWSSSRIPVSKLFTKNVYGLV